MLSLNFNPLAPRGARRFRRIGDDPHLCKFQSTSSSRSQTNSTVWYQDDVMDFNPLAPRGARRLTGPDAPRAENFNPLAPRGARQCRSRDFHAGKEFQSTSSSAEPDWNWQRITATRINFNPLAPRGARPIDGRYFKDP